MCLYRALKGLKLDSEQTHLPFLYATGEVNNLTGCWTITFHLDISEEHENIVRGYGRDTFFTEEELNSLIELKNYPEYSEEYKAWIAEKKEKRKNRGKLIGEADVKIKEIESQERVKIAQIESEERIKTKELLTQSLERQLDKGKITFEQYMEGLLKLK